MDKIPAPKDKHLVAFMLKRKFYSIGIEPEPTENYSASVYKKQLSEYEQ